MKALSQPQLEALARLNATSHDFRTIADYLRGELEAANRLMHKTQDCDQLLTARGAAATLAELIEKIDNARRVIQTRAERRAQRPAPPHSLNS